MKNLFSIFAAFGVVWILHVGYLISLMSRQNGLRQEIESLKAQVEEANKANKR